MRIGLWGVFGTRNFGNECTLHAVLDAARRHVPEGRISVICSQPVQAARDHHVETHPIGPDLDMGLPWKGVRTGRLRRLAMELRDLFRVARLVKQMDVLVICGTGIINDAHEPLLGLPFQLIKWTAAARLTRGKVIFVSVGVDGLSHGLKRRMLIWALRLAHYRSYRDPLSRRRVMAFFAGAEHDRVVPDLAFSLPRALVERAAHSREEMPVVALGLFGIDDSDGALERYVATISRIVAWLLSEGYRPRLVLGDLEYDRDVLSSLRKRLAELGLLSQVDSKAILSFEMLLDALSGTKFVVATRFHNVLLSLLLAKPVISLSHMEKNDELMEQMGLARFAIPLGGFDEKRFIDRFLLLRQQEPVITSALLDQRKLLRTRLEEQYRLIFRIPIGADT